MYVLLYLISVYCILYGCSTSVVDDAWHEHQQLFTVSPANYNLLGQSMELIDRLKLGCWVLVYHQHETALVYPSILQYALPLVHTKGQRCNRAEAIASTSLFSFRRYCRGL